MIHGTNDPWLSHSMLLLESSTYNDQRPRRQPTTSTTIPGVGTFSPVFQNEPKNWKDDWGIVQCPSSCFAAFPYDAFPETIDAVAESAAEMTGAVLWDTTGSLTDNEPNSGQQHASKHQRPNNNKNNRGGRMGIELDFGGGPKDAATLRHAALKMAAKLSTGTSTYQTSQADANISPPDADSSQQQTLRPIALYFNTVQQALAASQQLLQLKRMDLLRQCSQQRRPYESTRTSAVAQSSRPVSISTATKYDAIKIRCLCQGDSIPADMMYKNRRQQQTQNGTPMDPDTSTPRKKQKTTTKPKRRDALKPGSIDPEAGLVIVVQPTDYNTEYKPPGPAVTAVEALQRVATAATLEHLGVVVLSPRFAAAAVTQHHHQSAALDSSLPILPFAHQYQRQLSFHAEQESSPEPMPWILRDFMPPVYSWIAIPRKDTFYQVSNDKAMDIGRSHLVVWQSVTHHNPSWHVFQVSTANRHYMCSIARRPTWQALRELVKEFDAMRVI